MTTQDWTTPSPSSPAATVSVCFKLSPTPLLLIQTPPLSTTAKVHNKEEKKRKRKRDEDMDPSDFKDALDEEAAAEKLAKAKRDGERIKMLNRDINFLRDRTQAEDLEDEDKVHRDHEEHMEHVRHHRARMDEFSRQVDEEIKVVHEHARRNKDNYRFARDRHDRARNFEAEKEIDKVMRELKEQMARENSKKSSGSKSRRRKTSRDEL